jgi:alpha-D-ribose 1-methylphosphonate 5-triphosphate synthase subunit PhnI
MVCSLFLPASRATRLQMLARANGGFMLALAYAAQKGAASSHPYITEVRAGIAIVTIEIPELDFPVDVAEIVVSECHTADRIEPLPAEGPAFEQGYGIAFGLNERRAISMAILDHALNRGDRMEQPKHPSHDEAFLLLNSDSLEASGFIQHLKLPCYVDFESEMQLVHALRGIAR